jgi:hypothetical protein
LAAFVGQPVLGSKQEIRAIIEPMAWEGCNRVNAAEQESLRDILKNWRTGGKRN